MRYKNSNLTILFHIELTFRDFSAFLALSFIKSWVSSPRQNHVYRFLFLSSSMPQQSGTALGHIQHLSLFRPLSSCSLSLFYCIYPVVPRAVVLALDRLPFSPSVLSVLTGLIHSSGIYLAALLTIQIRC